MRHVKAMFRDVLWWSGKDSYSSLADRAFRLTDRKSHLRLAIAQTPCSKCILRMWLTSIDGVYFADCTHRAAIQHVKWSLSLNYFTEKCIAFLLISCTRLSKASFRNMFISNSNDKRTELHRLYWFESVEQQVFGLKMKGYVKCVCVIEDTARLLCVWPLHSDTVQYSN